MADLSLRYRTRTCKHCGTEFSYEIGSGMDRTVCTADCSRNVRIKKLAAFRNSRPTCNIESCTNRVRGKGSLICNFHYNRIRVASVGVCGVHKCGRPATRIGSGLCDTHYYRVRRNGTLDLLPVRNAYKHSAGYVVCRYPNHPLARTKGSAKNWVFEHRVIAYEKYGPTELSCHWCGVPIVWKTLHVDHLNEDKTDNDPSNLVVSCKQCNRARGQMKPLIKGLLPHRVEQFIECFKYMREPEPIA